MVALLSSALALCLSMGAGAANVTVGSGGTDFAVAEDGAASTNVATVGVLTLLQVTDSLTVNDLADVYRSEVTFDTQDADGPYWILKAKDDHAATPTQGFFEFNADECVAVTDFDSLIGLVGTRRGEVYTTDLGTPFRIGPYPTGFEPVSTGSSGASLLPPGWTSTHRASRLSFLTTGTHADDRDSFAQATYSVSLDYAGVGSDETFSIEIPRDNQASAGAMLVTSSGDAICNLGTVDTWCVAPHDTSASSSRLTAADCQCDGLSGTDAADACWVLQVDVLVDDTLSLEDATISWTDYDEGLNSIGLNGPMAVTLEIDEPTYDDLFVYDGRYVTMTDAIDAGAPAIWRRVEWDQSANDGEIRVAFDCGNASNGSDFTFGDWGEGEGVAYPFRSDENVPSFVLASATATAGDPAAYQDHCYGRYATFSAFLLDPNHPEGASAPRLDRVTLEFHLDADGDTYPQTAFPGSNPVDCDDANADINTETIYYADCDGDGLGDAGRTTSSCSVPTGGGVCPGGVDPIAWVSNALDCDDSDETATVSTADWFYDCDGDDHYQSVQDICNPSTDTATCFDGQPPDEYSMTTADFSGMDCDDSASTATLATADWFYDCDGDDHYQAVEDICNPAVDTATCFDGQAPDEYSMTTADFSGMDCDDGDPAAQVVDMCGVCGGDGDPASCDIFEDGFESPVAQRPGLPFNGPGAVCVDPARG